MSHLAMILLCVAVLILGILNGKPTGWAVFVLALAALFVTVGVWHGLG